MRSFIALNGTNAGANLIIDNNSPFDLDFKIFQRPSWQDQINFHVLANSSQNHDITNRIRGDTTRLSFSARGECLPSLDHNKFDLSNITITYEQIGDPKNPHYSCTVSAPLLSKPKK